MQTLVFDRHDLSLEYDNNCLIVRQPETKPCSLPLTHIQKILCLHSVKLTTSLLGQLWSRGIDFIIINNRYSERSLGLFPHQQTQVERRCKQYAWQLDESRCLELARELCRHRALLYARMFNTPETAALHQDCLERHAQMVHANSLAQLRGMEGSLVRRVFEHWRNLLPGRLGFHKRERRPVKDPVNALLSLTYTLVYQEAIRQCTQHGLDSQLGFYHRNSYGRHSLACDLMEPVRPYCEQWVVSCFENSTLDLRHFTRGKDRCLLGKQGRSVFYNEVQQQMPAWRRRLGAYARWLSSNLKKSIMEHPDAA